MKQKQEREKDFRFIREQFGERVRDGPDFVCCCHRLSFKNQALSFDREVLSRSSATASVADVH